MRRQEEGEPVDSFTTVVHNIASFAARASRTLQLCISYTLKRSDLRDSNLSERLQTDPELTIDKAITMAR